MENFEKLNVITAMVFHKKMFHYWIQKNSKQKQGNKHTEAENFILT
jgi:hypothetical protein